MLATTALFGELHKPGNENVLVKVRSEIASLQGQAVTTEMCASADYVSSCINEALRLYPFAGGIPKILPAGEALQILGKQVQGPIDVTLWFSHTFTDPIFFPKPMEFLPERWLPDAEADIKA